LKSTLPGSDVHEFDLNWPTLVRLENAIHDVGEDRQFKRCLLIDNLHLPHRSVDPHGPAHAYRTTRRSRLNSELVRPERVFTTILREGAAGGRIARDSNDNSTE
jgi:hypothetical protein